MQKLVVLLVGISAEIKAILKEIANKDQIEFTDTSDAQEAHAIIIDTDSAETAPPPGIPSFIITSAAKPIRIAELFEWLSRVSVSNRNSDVALSSDIILDITMCQLKNSSNNEIVDLTDKETKLAENLANPDSLCDRESLLQNVWGYGENIETRTLETHINRLRRKLEQISDNKITVISTRNGYILEFDGNKDIVPQ